MKVLFASVQRTRAIVSAARATAGKPIGMSTPMEVASLTG